MYFFRRGTSHILALFHVLRLIWTYVVAHFWAFLFSCLSPDPSCFLPCHSAFSILKAINKSFLITLPVPLPFTTNPSPLPFLLPLLCWFQPNHPSFKLHCFSRPWPAPSSSIHLWSELALAAKYFKCGDTVYWLFFYLFF